MDITIYLVVIYVIMSKLKVTQIIRLTLTNIILANRPEFGGTVPIFHLVSRIPNYPENVLYFATCPYFHRDKTLLLYY